MWEVVLLASVDRWFMDLAETDPDSASQVAGAIDLLEREGPVLGRPAVDRVKGSRLHNMKELRPGSAGTTEVRILFVFDPARRAILLVAGDKSGSWKQWYYTNIPLAERRYQGWLDDEPDEEH